MPLPAGASDKFGNRYERWWTVSQLLRMLHGQAESIRIEDPGVTKAEFVVVSGARRDLHQAKRSSPEGKWSLAALASSDMQLLQAMFAQLSGNSNRFVFVSGSDAPELKELAHRATMAESVEEFEAKFIEAKVQQAHFEKLRKHWGGVSAAAVYEMLRRVEVRTIDERSIEELVESQSCALFLAKPREVCNELRSITEDFVHQTVTRDSLVELLAKRGFKLRQLAKLEAAPALVHDVTERYLAVVKRKLIRRSLIPRAATQALLARMAPNAGGGESVLTGKAGAGKTGCVIELVESLRAREIPVVVLAFRLDRVGNVSTTTELGKQLGMDESPALVLAAAAAGREAVLVVDQLDAVSTASGRSSDFLEAVEGLLSEARGLRDRVKLHVVLVCRAFDWENDHRLRRMLSKQHASIEVTEFSPDEVKAVLSADEFRPGLFQPGQLKLLGLAQNLSLFLDSGFDPAKAPHFNTAKELFDRYWEEKRRAVAERAAPLPDQWKDVIQVLCGEMTRTQQLSVLRETLDGFAPDYVAQMASEGVVTFDGERYGFGHESFFDYCFARDFVVKAQSLAEFLVASEQHLFRRAQVRQVLAYLRDGNRYRYTNELRALLGNNRVRIHIKDLAVALVMNVPDPDEDEWSVVEPWLNLELAAFSGGQRHGDKFASLVWQHFFVSTSWFHLVDRRGLVAAWLASGNASVINMSVNYARIHQRQAGDRVAELLEPFVGKGGDWPLRLRHVMEWADHENSRRFFDLFLRLVDDGTLDEARGPIASNSTFWSMLHGMARTRPGWVAEVLAHWLRRRIALIQQQKPAGGELSWGELFNHDHFGWEDFHTSATKAPAEFVRHVLPVILEITDATTYSESKPPKRDAVWPILINSQHETCGCACRNALAAALDALAKSQPDKLGDAIQELRHRETYMANFFLLNLYAAGAVHFADTAAVLLCEQPWRFHCGYSDNGYWVAICLIRTIVPCCSPENRAKLEATILDFAPDYERGKDGYKFAGSACFELLSAIPPEHRSRGGQTRFEQLERKFRKPAASPQGARVYTVVSPIEQQAAERMTDEQWLKAIAKYGSADRVHRWEHPEKGGAWELAGQLREFVRNEPDRFARLSLTFPAGTNPAYIERTLDGLKGTGIATQLKLAVCYKAYAESRQECSKAIADLLGSIEEPLPDDAVNMLDWLSTQHPDPEKELWNEEATAGRPYYGGDILTHGINTTRGRAAEAIRDLIAKDARYIARFRTTLGRLVCDKSVAVRTCVGSTLIAVARHDAPLASELFDNLVAADDRLLATHYVDRFLYLGLNDNWARLRRHVERMFNSKESSVMEAGSRLASLAALSHEDAGELVKQAMGGNPSQRLGVARVAAHNIAIAQCRAWCETHLLALFSDGDTAVRHEAASCFRQLEGEPLEKYESLITAFCDSEAYKQDSFQSSMQWKTPYVAFQE